MQTRDQIHRLVDELPDGELPDALRAIEQFLDDRRRTSDSLERALANVREDDEPLTVEEEAALEEAYADVAAGRIVSDDEVWRRLGHDEAR